MVSRWRFVQTSVAGVASFLSIPPRVARTQVTSKFLLPLLCLLLAPAARAASWAVPLVNGPLTIDGLIEEDTWKQAAVLPMQASDYGPAFPQGGETRALVRGQYLCLGARLPESGRVVARSTGENPAWWQGGLDYLDRSLPCLGRNAQDQH